MAEANISCFVSPRFAAYPTTGWAHHGIQTANGPRDLPSGAKGDSSQPLQSTQSRGKRLDLPYPRDRLLLAATLGAQVGLHGVTVCTHHHRPTVDTSDILQVNQSWLAFIVNQFVSYLGVFLLSVSHVFSLKHGWWCQMRNDFSVVLKSAAGSPMS